MRTESAKIIAETEAAREYEDAAPAEFADAGRSFADYCRGLAGAGPAVAAVSVPEFVWTA